jgi:hypothetical protein
MGGMVYPFEGPVSQNGLYRPFQHSHYPWGVMTLRDATVSEDDPSTDDGLGRGYDHEITTTVRPDIRRRFGYSHDRGEVTRFVMQLEYRLEGEWTAIVRYDHDAVTDHGGHDVTEEGLHIDIYRDGEKGEQEYLAPPMPAGVALDFAEGHLEENLERFIERFEQWHEIRTP